jgi:hypothetical protein
MAAGSGVAAAVEHVAQANRVREPAERGLAGVDHPRREREGLARPRREPHRR